MGSENGQLKHSFELGHGAPTDKSALKAATVRENRENQDIGFEKKAATLALLNRLRVLFL